MNGAVNKVLITTHEGILYCWIESFGVVFIGNHGFNLGQNGLAFIVSHSNLPATLVY